MIPNLGKHQTAEPVEGQLTVTNPVDETNGATTEMTFPLELIFEILNHLSLNGWRLMNQLSKPFACYMERGWKELSKQEGLYFGWPGCPLDAQPKENLPYPEQTRYFQGKLLQDYFCSEAFSKSIYFKAHAQRVISISCGEDSLEICPPVSGLENQEGKMIQQIFKGKNYQVCGMGQLAQKDQKTLSSLSFFFIRPEIKEQIEKQAKNLDNIYQSLKKRMIVFPSVGAYIWADLTHLARMIPESSFPFKDSPLFESNKINSEDQAGNYLLNGLSCLTKLFKEAIVGVGHLKQGSAKINGEVHPLSCVAYLLKPPHEQHALYQSSLECLGQAISQGATLASELAFKILNRGYFSFYKQGWRFGSPHITKLIHSYSSLSFYSADQGNQRGLVESLKFYEAINPNKRIHTLVMWYQNSCFYPDLLFSMARLSDSPDGEKRQALLQSDFRGYGPNLSQELKTLIIEGWEVLEGPNLPEESKLLLREKEEKVRALIKQGMSFAEHNVWYQRASILFGRINRALQQEREKQGIETEDGEELFFALTIKANIRQIPTSSNESIKLNLLRANFLIKTAIESFENNHLPVPGEVLAVAAILKWYQQDPNSAKTYMDQLFDTYLSQKQESTVYHTLITFFYSLDPNGKELESYIKRLPAQAWFGMAQEIVGNGEAADVINSWFVKMSSAGEPIPRTVWLVAGLWQETASEPNIKQGIEWISKGLQVPYNKNEDVNEEDYLDLLSLDLMEKYQLDGDSYQGFGEQVEQVSAELMSVTIDLIQKTPDQPQFPPGFYQFFQNYGLYGIKGTPMIGQIRAYAKSYDQQIQARLLAGLCDVYLQDRERGWNTLSPEFRRYMQTKYKELEAWIEEAIAVYEGHLPSWMSEIAKKIKQKLREYAI